MERKTGKWVAYSYVFVFTLIGIGIIIVGLLLFRHYMSLETPKELANFSVDTPSLVLTLVMLIIGIITLLGAIIGYSIQRKLTLLDKVITDIERVDKNVILSADIVTSHILPALSETQHLPERYKSLLESAKPLWEHVEWIEKLEKTGNASKIWFAKALYLILSDEIERAIGVLEKIINSPIVSKEMKRDVRYRKGICYRQLENYKKSIEAFEEMERWHPKDRDLARVMQGITYFAWAKKSSKKSSEKKICSAWKVFKDSAEKLKTNTMVATNVSRFFFYILEKQLYDLVNIYKEDIILKVFNYTSQYLETAVLWSGLPADVPIRANRYECVGNGYYFYGWIYSDKGNPLKTDVPHFIAFYYFTMAIKYYQHAKENADRAAEDSSIYSEDKDIEIRRDDFIKEVDEKISDTFKKICNEWNEVIKEYIKNSKKLNNEIKGFCKAENLVSKKIESIKKNLYREIKMLPLIKIKEQIDGICKNGEEKVEKLLKLLEDVRRENVTLKDIEQCIEITKANYEKVKNLDDECEKIRKRYPKEKYYIEYYIKFKNIIRLLDDIIKAPSKCIKEIRKELRSKDK